MTGRVLVTGAAGFIGGYLVPELLSQGYDVTGLDDYSKYGPVRRRYDDDPRYRLVVGDARDAGLVRELLEGCDHLVAAAALIGGIPYFHAYAYDLLAANERITASTFDAAIAAHARGTGQLRKITVVSSSMVYESTDRWPSAEGDELSVPPPRSSYGFQKLATEYFARAAWEQHGLPYTVVRPFNCVGTGEGRALGSAEVLSGNVKLAMSHVVPDLVHKTVKGQDPLRVLGDGSQVRHYTYGADLARGVRLAMESDAAVGQAFNLSTATATTVRELAAAVWARVHGPDRPLALAHDPAYPHDVARRVPDTGKAARVLGFEATTTLAAMLDEVVPWVAGAVEEGRL